MLFTAERIQKIKKLVASRQYDLTVILENVHDPHNLGAVIRSCEAVGVLDVHIVYSEVGKNSEHLYIGKRASRGAKRWVRTHFYTDIKSCVDELKKNGFEIWATHLAKEASSIYNIDLRNQVALLFGNEKDGLSEEALQLADGNFIVPTYGMVQSLNISVACAISLFEASRQRILAGKYENIFDINEPNMRKCLVDYVTDLHPRIVAINPGIIDELINQL